MSYSRVEVASDTRHSARCCSRPPLLRCNEVDVVARREATAVILFKQKVEIATLPSVARNDITLLEVTARQQVARDDNFNLTKVVRFARPKGKRWRHKIISYPSEIFCIMCRQIL